MLTIENILKLEGRPLADGWMVQLIYEISQLERIVMNKEKL